MIKDAKAFLKDLQKDCIKDGEDYLNAMREELIKMKKNPLDCINAILKILHSMKGNFQAAAFIYFGKYVHELETILDKKHTDLASAVGKSIHESDILDFEFLMSGSILALDSYLDVLKRVGDDNEDYFNQRSESLASVSNWNPMFMDVAQLGPSAHDNYKVQISELSVKAEPKIDPIDDDFFASAAPVAQEISVSASTYNSASVSDYSSKYSQAKESDAEENLLYLLFQNCQKHFAIEIEHVVEVIKAQPLSTPPFQRKNLSGLLNLRGEVLPIIKVPQIELAAQSKPTYIVVSEINELRFGFQVESVHQVISFDSKTFQPVHGLVIDDEVGHSPHRFCQVDDKTVSIISATDVLAQLNIMDAA